ncbi:MAG TPA: inorganic phosphate transporter, partial [Candidatus Eremiobacteraceae bacterium]|nr:inorganic phosphate transporter [Candidatus Eremiobacteraceae bacterium]
AVHWAGVERVALSMLASVVVGAAAGAIIFAVVTAVLAQVGWGIGVRILELQYVTVGLLALGYGANDLEKSIGLIALGSGGNGFTVPGWSIAVAGACFALGMGVGGIRVAKTVGGKLFVVRPYAALSFQLAAAATVIGAALAGGPLSTTQTTASAMVGVGGEGHPRAVHWQVVGRIAASWVLTAPFAFAAGALAGLLVR